MNIGVPFVERVDLTHARQVKRKPKYRRHINVLINPGIYDWKILFYKFSRIFYFKINHISM